MLVYLLFGVVRRGGIKNEAAEIGRLLKVIDF
jgi:hypothetical protein